MSDLIKAIHKLHNQKVKAIKQEFKDNDPALSSILNSLGIPKEEFFKSFERVIK